MVEVPESNEVSAVWNEFGLGALLDDDANESLQRGYGGGAPSPIQHQQQRRTDGLQSVLRRVGPSPEKKQKMQLPYMKAMVGRYGTLPAERKVANSQVIDRLADKYANLDMLTALTPRAQARRREKAERDVDEARRERERRERQQRKLMRNPMGLKLRGGRRGGNGGGGGGDGEGGGGRGRGGGGPKTESPQRRSRSATGLSVSASAKALPVKRDANTGGSSSSKKGAKAAWGSSSTAITASAPELPRHNPLHDASAAEEDAENAKPYSLRAQARARRAAGGGDRSNRAGRRAEGNGVSVHKPRWSSVSPERRGGGGGGRGGGGGGENKDDSIDSLDLKIMATYNRVTNRSREQAEQITKSLLGEVAKDSELGSPPPPGQGTDDDDDDIALSDWEIKSRLAKDRARRRQREKEARNEGRFVTDEEGEVGGGAFALTALSGQVAESQETGGGYYIDDADDPFGVSVGGRIEIASVRPAVGGGGGTFVAPKALEPIGNPFMSGAGRGGGGGGGGVRLRRSRRVRPGLRGADAGADEGGETRQGGARRRRSSRDRGAWNNKTGGGGGGGDGEGRWLGDTPLKRSAKEAEAEARAKERAKERAEKREARMLAKRKSKGRFGLQPQLAGTMRRSTKNRTGGGASDPLSSNQTGRRKGSDPMAKKPAPAWQKNALSAAERRERGDRARKARKEAKKAASKAALSESRGGGGGVDGAAEGGQMPPKQQEQRRKKKKPSDFDVIEQEFHRSEKESKAAMDATAAFLAKLRADEKAKQEEERRRAGLDGSEAQTLHDDSTSVDLLNALQKAAQFGADYVEEPSGGFFLTQGFGADDGANEGSEGGDAAVHHGAGRSDPDNGNNAAQEVPEQSDANADGENRHPSGAAQTPHHGPQQKHAMERLKTHQEKLEALQERFAKSSAAAQMMFRVAAEDDAIGKIVSSATSPKKDINPSPGADQLHPGQNAMLKLGDYAYTKPTIQTPLPKIAGGSSRAKPSKFGAAYQRKASS